MTAVQAYPVGTVPAARSIRRFTARAPRGRGEGRLGALLGDLYTALVSVAVSAGVGLGAVQQLRVALPPPPEVPPPVGLSLPVVVAVLLVGAAGALLSLAGRLGPVGAGGAEAVWWLTLPVERRGLLRPAAARLPVLAAPAAAVLVTLLSAGLLGHTGAGLLRAALVAALGAAAVVLAAALVQSAGLPRRATALTGDLLMVAAPVGAAVLALSGAAPSTLPVPGWAVVVAVALVVAALAAVLDARLGRLPARTVRDSGSVAAQALGAVVSLDSRELGRALAGAVLRPGRRWSSRLRTVRGPATALVTADLVLLRRSTRHLVQLGVAVLVPVLVTVVPQLASPVGVLVAVLVAGAAAASAAADGARWAQMAPVLDRSLPLRHTTVRRLRMVVPGLVALGWSAVTLGAVALWSEGPLLDWLVLAVASAPVWAAAAVRAAYRPAPEWGGRLVITEAGALPLGALAVLSKGPDLVALCLLPLWVAIGVAAVTTPVVTAQVVLSAVAVLVASSTHEKGWFERSLEGEQRGRPAAGGAGGAA
ncbi:DUF6297 family protein [Cellulomonas telluris]|uniref:DUF6297 family protein n=1 Tax=Cellulomonas telluris TaxID=2306636 RepID=UPI0010A89A0F|nr:DUF6297 family protein [Cellulomonas telluris]